MRAIRIIHPFPTALNVLAVAGLAVVAADGTPDAGLLLRMLAAMLAIQSTIGVVNDIFDRELDAETKPWKPIPSRAVPFRAAVQFALILGAVAVLLSATLGLAGFALAMTGLACGLAYDMKLKRTVISALPFMVAIPVLPLWVWAVLGEWEAALWWLLPLGALLGLAIHLANTAPDINSDAQHGVRGLAHRLGPVRSLAVAWAAFGLALATSVVLLPIVSYRLAVYLPALCLAAGSLALSIGIYAAYRSAWALQAGFGLLGAGAAIAAVGWLAAVT
jgi:4-hydroxybenzoate polyprenyltransferase